MDQTPNGSPVEYPTVRIKGQDIPLKFSNGALYRLDKAGVDLQQIGADLKSGKVKISMIYDMLSACLVGTGVWNQRYSGEELAEEISPKEAADAVIAALGKVPRPVEVTLREPATTQARPQ